MSALLDRVAVVAMYLHTSVFELMGRSLAEFQEWEAAVSRVTYAGK